MSAITNTPTGAKVETDEWTIEWSAQTLDLTCKTPNKKHTRLCGDPHIMTDGGPNMDFPSPTCSFVLTDGTLVVADAPAANQALNDVHVFTTDAKHFSLGQSKPFDDVVGTMFVQNADGTFYGVVSRDVGTQNPNPVRKAYHDLP
jgi:hypothetical protein